jgi:hypothetical protein
LFELSAYHIVRDWFCADSLSQVLIHALLVLNGGSFSYWDESVKAVGRKILCMIFQRNKEIKIHLGRSTWLGMLIAFAWAENACCTLLIVMGRHLVLMLNFVLCPV